ncbi:Probable replication-associated protein RepA1 (plasmid) [Buchnera aphidicola (Eriosoma grossulariae)]|uniref:plasmid replication initiator RepA n=1 Tax=Buchnera aphidicola TaxID=9 RepID=UPI003464DA04
MFNKKKYVNNPFPKFKIPKNDKPRPQFIRYAMQKAMNNDVARGEIYYVIQPKNIKTGLTIPRRRRLNEHRACALRAMVLAMLYHFNLTSNLVYASVEQLSDECGLSTMSKSGNKSISRASRLITEFMEPMGFIKSEKKWDNVLGNYMPKIITLTPLFFLLFDISLNNLMQAKKQQLEWINKELKKQGLKTTTEKQIIMNIKSTRMKKISEFRQSKHKFYIRQKKAKKIISNNENIAKQNILRTLVKNFTLKELQNMGQNGLKKRVNIEYYYLKKIATSTYINNIK